MLQLAVALLSLQETVDEDLDLVEVERLLDVIDGPASHRLDRVLHGAVSRHQYNGNGGIDGVQLGQHVEARAVRKSQVE